ncbi:MAG TPA: peptidoglycan-binding protein [Chroococcales cyanobacterium]
MASVATTHPTLMSGSVGEEVTYLQQLLNQKGRATIKVDGYFGDETKQMVEIYQRNHGLVVDGIVGQQTWSSLEGNQVASPAPTLTHPTLMEGSSGDDVIYLQQLLNKKGRATIAVDGYFGSSTKQMVEIHQRNHELVVDGIVGPQTWSSLES